VIVVVGLSHKTAPIEVRERLAIGRDALPEVLGRLLKEPAIGEAMVISTCNRVEVYAAPRRAPEDLEDTARAITRVLASMGGETAAGHLARAHGTEAVRHLFRVAASLDSLVLGEPQILGQLKDAIVAARDAKALGPTLGKAAHRAVRVGKRVRTETALGAGQVSVSSVAVDLAQQIFEELEGRVTLLVGAGEMAEAAAKLLARAGARLILVNRSPERASALARDLGTGEVRPWGDLQRSLVEADIVISSTSSPGYVITRDLAKTANKSRRGRSLFFIDIAVPRDVEPSVNKLDNVFLYDVDDLSQIVSESLEGRAAEAARAEAIILEECSSFETWTLERALTPTIVGLRERTRALLAAELDRSLSGKLKHLSPADRDALRVMLEAATNKLMHTPTTRLRALATDPRGTDYMEALRELFDLPEGSDEQAADDAGAGQDAPNGGDRARDQGEQGWSDDRRESYPEAAREGGEEAAHARGGRSNPPGIQGASSKGAGL
jgi:glutamyl-tRNA reductase